jgi:hypothetical protein
MFLKAQKESDMFYRVYEVSNHDAHTLSQSDLGEDASGWVVTGSVQSDYYEWVNEFEAVHPTHGKVWGDFEKTVYADNKEGFDDFVKNHPPESWSYWDI